MDIIIGQRGSGRTMKLIEACSKDKGSVIVCPTSHMAKWTSDLAKQLGYDIAEPISFDTFCKGRVQGKKIPKYYFDNLDLSLQQCAGYSSIGAATFELHNMEVMMADTTYNS